MIIDHGYDCAMNQRDQGSRGPDARPVGPTFCEHNVFFLLEKTQKVAPERTSYGTQTDAVKTGVGSGRALPLPDP